MQFTCSKCSRGALQASAHQCKSCTFSTYSAYAYCVCCALEKDKCQSCETDMKSVSYTHLTLPTIYSV